VDASYNNMGVVLKKTAGLSKSTPAGGCQPPRCGEGERASERGREFAMTFIHFDTDWRARVKTTLVLPVSCPLCVCVCMYVSYVRTYMLRPN
jgi:hypothetical protein